MGSGNPMGMGMSGMGQVSSLPPGQGGYGNSSMLQVSGGTINPAGVANGNNNGQGNVSSVTSVNSVSDMGGSGMQNQMNSASNPMVSSLAPSIGGMGGNLMSNPGYQPGSQVGMSARSQGGDQTGYSQGGGGSASGDNNNTNVLSLLLKGDRPSVKSQMGMRPMRHPSQPVCVYAMQSD